MRETCTSGSVRGEGGNILTYSAQNRRRMSWRFMLELQTILPTPRVRSARAATHSRGSGAPSSECHIIVAAGTAIRSLRRKQSSPL